MLMLHNTSNMEPLYMYVHCIAVTIYEMYMYQYDSIVLLCVHGCLAIMLNPIKQ